MNVRLLLIAGLLASLQWGCERNLEQSGEVCDQSPGELFERHVAPLLAAEHPSTCGQCHGGAIALGDFLRPSPCESMACLKQAGLVDLEHPERSVLLAWIERAEPDSTLITQETIQQEHSAFLSWIEHESECQNCADVNCSEKEPLACDTGSELGGSYDQKSDPLDCTGQTLERLFRGTVYSWRGRCSPCHFKEEERATKDAPKWISRTGDCKVASLATFQNVLGQGYIDDDNASDSLLLLKPLAEFDGGLKHGGHDKFVKKADRGYDDFLYFIQRYVACENGESFEASWGGNLPD